MKKAQVLLSSKFPFVPSNSIAIMVCNLSPVHTARPTHICIGTQYPHRCMSPIITWSLGRLHTGPKPYTLITILSHFTILFIIHIWPYLSIMGGKITRSPNDITYRLDKSII